MDANAAMKPCVCNLYSCYVCHPPAPPKPTTLTLPVGPGSDEAVEAISLVNGARQSAYGPPAKNYEGIAKMWSGMLVNKLNRDITAEEAALMMAAMKIQRQCMKSKRDNRVDAYGYLAVAAHCNPNPDGQ